VFAHGFNATSNWEDFMIDKRIIASLAGLVLVLGTISAYAHVRVSPTDAKAGAKIVYMVTIPTEGKVPTSRVELVLPKGASLVSVDDEGKPFDVQHPADGTTVIVWNSEIPPGWAKMFHFTVTNPTGVSEIAWKAHQYFKDGTSADWVDAPGAKRPASVTKLNP
jgi:uncharacterized protein YcnI